MTIEQAREARGRLKPYLPTTPLVFSEALSRATGNRVWLKLESLQPTGAFKVRPALNGMLANLNKARKVGVIASSSGNFAQAVAYAARELGVSAQIVMMKKSSPFKIEGTRRLGGEVVLCENTFKDRWDTTFRLERESGRLLLHPYDSEDTIAGDATIGLELAEQLDSDFTVLVPISGGGLIAGIASAIKVERPGCTVIGVQPSANGSMKKSMEQGSRVTVTPGPSMADALVVGTPGERTFAIVQKLVADVVLVEEAEIAIAVRTLAVEQKLIAEPGGAVGVAALLAGRVKPTGRDVVCILSGGNIQPAKLAELLAAQVL